MNNQVVEIQSIADDRRSAVVVAKGRRCELDLSHPHQHWDHAYASTVHAQQGATAERVIAYVDTEAGRSFGRESWYVTLTRGKVDVRSYTNDSDGLEFAARKSQAQLSALDAEDQRTRLSDVQRAMPGGPEIGNVE